MVFTLRGARSFWGLTSKVPPLGFVLNFDAEVKTGPRVTQCENRVTHRRRRRHAAGAHARRRAGVRGGRAAAARAHLLRPRSQHRPLVRVQVPDELR